MSASKKERQLEAKIAALQAQIDATKSDKPKEDPKTKVEDKVITTLRADVAKLEAAAHLLPGGLLDGKKAELEKELQARRAGRPLDARVREVQETVARRQKALDKQRAVVAGLKEELEEAAKKLHEAEEAEAGLAGKLAEIEAVQVELFKQRTVEAAAAAKVDLGPGPSAVQALGLRLDKVKGEDLPQGITKEQLVAAFDIIAKLVGADEAAPAVPAPGVLAAPAATPHSGTTAAASGGEAKDEDDDQIQDFDMEDENLLGTLEAEDRAAFKLVKVRLQERGMGISCSGRRVKSRLQK